MAEDDLMIDEQEIGERQEAADDLDERHLVDYCIESADESRRARKEILDAMALLWDGYQNMMDFGDKEEWQSRVVTNKPFTAVERAISIIRRAFKNPNYINVEGVEVSDKDISVEIKDALSFWARHRNVQLPSVFCNAARMAMAVGLSLEMIPRWENGMVLDWTEPWKILRDPDALPGKPWSGNYWIHEEWMDMYKLKEAEGFYINLDRVKEGGDYANKDLSKEEIERRKKMYWERTQYRKSVLVREFNGVVMDRRGEMLLPSAKYTIAGDVLIRRPVATPYVNMRWPGNSFAPIPHILRYDGRGIIEGVYELWKMLNKMLSLSMDDFSWVVNRMREVFPELLLDPTDLDFYPGKDIFRSTDLPDTPIVKDLLAKSNMADLLAFAQYIGTQIDNGDFVTEFVQGLPGTRSQITKGEVELKTEQNMGIFDSIGTEVEMGAVNLGQAMYETMILNWDAESDPSPTRVLGDTEFAAMLEGASLEEKKQFLKLDCDVRITGISAQLEMAEKAKLLMAFKAYAESPMFQQYFKNRELLNETLGALGMWKPPFIKSEEELKTEQIGSEIVQALGAMVQKGGPEVEARVRQFLQEVMSGNGGMGGAVPTGQPTGRAPEVEGVTAPGAGGEGLAPPVPFPTT